MTNGGGGHQYLGGAIQEHDEHAILMSILLLLSSLLERISSHFVNVHVWRRRFSKVCIKFSMFQLSN